MQAGYCLRVGHGAAYAPYRLSTGAAPHQLHCNSLQGVENKKTYELNEEEINKLRDEVGKYTTESDLVSCHPHLLANAGYDVIHQAGSTW